MPTEEGYKSAAEKLSYNEKIRPVLVEVIRNQYQHTGIELNENLITQLAAPGALTVCTGHQLCLFTGPLYFIYKIITTIKVAEQQSILLGKNVVPVYWMATEDHDFEEISSINIFGKKITWEENAAGGVGDLKTNSLKKVVAELISLLGDSVNAKQLSSVLEKAYRPGRTLAQATREFVNDLFNGKIIILDANDAKLKHFFIPVLKVEIENGNAARLVNETISELAALDYPAQVQPREINLFYKQPGFRERIEKVNDRFLVLNSKISFSKEELKKEIDSYPERFSPNVVLRPLYQQMILPNLAYIGGPGELSYWLEYKKMFDHFKVSFPILQPRHFILLTDKNMTERLSKFEISMEELFGDIEEVIKNFVRKNSGASLSFDDEKQELEKVFEKIREKIIPIDATLKGTVDAELQKQLNAISAIEAKVMRAAKQKQETAIAQIRKVREKILPNGVLQERFENFIPHYLKHGESCIT
ncbi:bacillithiol biosynthesis cysteine-adding enzyme BshC [soil metagenome]